VTTVTTGTPWPRARGRVAGRARRFAARALRPAARALRIAAFEATQKLLMPSGFAVNLIDLVYGQTRQT
jgi:hypothetical protein